MNIRHRGRGARRVVAALAFAIGALAMANAMAGSNGIVVEHAWVRATPSGAIAGAAYVTLVNNGVSDDRLLGVTSPVAGSIQFHSETNDDGVMKMVQLPALDVQSGASVVLKPGGIHMMLLHLKQQIRKGESVPLIFSFERAGTIEVMARVGKVGAMNDPATEPGGGG